MKSDAGAISADYAAIVALSIRQGFGGIEITVSKNHDGSFDSSNTLAFMKGVYIPILTSLAGSELTACLKQKSQPMVYVAPTQRLLTRSTDTCACSA